MVAEFRHLDGPAAGQVRVLTREFATIGRHPSADIQFDSERDLDVSGRHAAVFRQGDSWVLRDLGSTNGTWVNGSRLRGDYVLAEEDVVQLGPRGPRLAFRTAREAAGPLPPTRVEAAPAGDTVTAPLRPPRVRIAKPTGTTARVQREVHRRTATARRVAVAALVIAGAALALLGWNALGQRRAVRAERARLLARSDSLLTRLDAASTGIAALREELDRARRETTALRAAIAEGASLGALDSLGRRLAAGSVRQQGVARTAALDPLAIAAAESGALAVVLAEFPGGERLLGSGFAIRLRGDTGWIVTARHLVVDSLGRPARRLGTIFNGSAQNFRAETALVSDSADLALLTVRIRGGMPVLRGPGPGAVPGDPAVILGFPSGLDRPGGGDWRLDGVQVSRFTATVDAAREGRLELDGYGTHGSSGSPVLNAAGEVVGVVFGGDPGSGGRRLYAVPSRALAALLAAPGGPDRPDR